MIIQSPECNFGNILSPTILIILSSSSFIGTLKITRYKNFFICIVRFYTLNVCCQAYARYMTKHFNIITVFIHIMCSIVVFSQKNIINRYFFFLGDFQYFVIRNCIASFPIAQSIWFYIVSIAKISIVTYVKFFISYPKKFLSLSYCEFLCCFYTH